jgi:hypothetical protein
MNKLRFPVGRGAPITSERASSPSPVHLVTANHGKYISIRSTVSQLLLRALFRLKLLIKWVSFNLWTTEAGRSRRWPTLSGVDNHHVFTGDAPSSIVMVRLDRSDSRCNVRLKSVVAEVYSLLAVNDGKLAFKVSLAVRQVTVMFGHHAQIAIA